MKLNDLRTLGRSGLPVSPLCLGTMTFGTPRWGSPDEVSEAIFHRFLDAGGNFIDTADVYAKGRSEELIAQFLAKDAGLRDRIVLASKFTFNNTPENPLSGGNSRKNAMRAIEGSLRRLKTDYLDLYWMHTWDKVTPVEEVVETLAILVRAGKIRYYGFSDVPAWYAAKAAVLAETHGVPGPIALQLEYSLVERGIEREHVDAALQCGMGICPWSPLASGFLAGKYTRNADGRGATGTGRLDTLKEGTNPAFKKFTEPNWRSLETLREVAGEAGRPLAQVALAWALQKPGITSLIIGASKMEQLEDNLRSLEVELSPEQIAKLDAASATEPGHPYMFFSGELHDRIFGGLKVRGFPGR